MRYVLIASLVLLIAVAFNPSTAAQDQDSWIYAFDYSAASGLYATGHYDWTIRIWDAESDEVIFAIQAPDLRPENGNDIFSIQQLAFSPSGNRLAASLLGDGSGLILIIDTSTGQILTKIADIPSAHVIAWSPDDSFIAGTYDYYPFTRGSVYLAVWDAETGDELNQVGWGDASVVGLDFHPTGAPLAFTVGGWVVLWNVDRWQERDRLLVDEIAVTSIAWSPSGNTLASVGSEGVIRLWDGATYTLQQEIAATVFEHDRPVVFWSDDGAFIGSSSSTRIEIWDVATGAQTFSDDVPERIKGIALRSDGTLFYATKSGVYRIELH